MTTTFTSPAAPIDVLVEFNIARRVNDHRSILSIEVRSRAALPSPASIIQTFHGNKRHYKLFRGYTDDAALRMAVGGHIANQLTEHEQLTTYYELTALDSIKDIAVLPSTAGKFECWTFTLNPKSDIKKYLTFIGTYYLNKASRSSEGFEVFGEQSISA